MPRRFSRSSDHRRNRKALRKTLLRTEPLEPRAMLSASGLASFFPHAAALGTFGAPVNQAPVVVNSLAIGLSPVVTTRTAVLSVLGADDESEAGLAYSWTVARRPAGGTAAFSASGSNDAKNTTVTFSKAGAYQLVARITDSHGLSVTSTATVAVRSSLTNITVVQASTGTLANGGSAVATSGTTDRFVVRGYDQFGKALARQPSLVWSATTLPGGATAPSFGVRGNTSTVTYRQAGSYGLSVRATDAGGVSVTIAVTEIVTGVLSSFTMTPSTSFIVTPNATQQFTLQRVTDQFGRDLVNPTTLNWSTLSKPSGAALPTFTSDGNTTTVAFSKAGTYKLSARVTDPASGRSLTKTVSVRTTMTPVLNSLAITPGSGAVVRGTSQQFAAQGFDQFGAAYNLAATYTWSATTLPEGAAAPTFSANRSSAARNTTATFSQAGTYGLTVTAVASGRSVSSTVTLIVDQTLSSIVVTPGSGSFEPGATQQFTAEALDQFGEQMEAQPDFAWDAAAGQIDATGLWTAPATAGNVTVTASSGSTSGTATVVVGSSSPTLDLVDSGLESVVQTLVADGSISRLDMIQILRSAGSDDGVVDTMEFGDLHTILGNASMLGIADYVEVLAGNVVSGNPANAQYQGQTLGNLTTQSSADQLNKLIDKWFLGADHPAAGSYTYRSTAGSLFVGGPAYTDTYQGYLGDCYFIASLGTIAKSDPDAIENMILDNGDGTWTVRFYAGSFGYSYLGNSAWDYGYQGTATADYVTVDRMLPTDSWGRLIYANIGDSYTSAGNELWIPLLEKAYAQWNETGRTNRGNDSGVNAYANIEGGWMSDVYNQVLGHDAIDVQLTSTTRQTMIDALAANKAVTIGTKSLSTVTNGLYGSHAYQVVGYNSSNGTFTLYNPWGDTHPGPLTWSQLQSTCDLFSIADASENTPFLTPRTVPAPVAAHANAPSAEASALLAWLADSRAGRQSLASPATHSGHASETLPAPTVDALLAAGAYV